MKKLNPVLLVMKSLGLLCVLLLLSRCQSADSRESSGAAIRDRLANARTADSVNAVRFSILNSPTTLRMQEALDEFFQHHLGKRFNGAILVARKGVVIYEKYQGYADLAKRIPIDEHTTFQLASTSKPFLAMAVLWLYQRGKLDLNDPVQKYFPNFPYKGVTIKLLLNHRSGLPNYLYCCQPYWKNPSRLMTNQDVVRILCQYHPRPIYKPDTHFNYSNTNYCVLAAIVEDITHEPYGEFLKRIFFEPLGMHDTYVYTPREPAPANQSISYDARGRKVRTVPFDGVVGDKNVFSTVEDLLKWDQALYSGKLFPDSILRLAYTPYSNERPSIHNYGLGWRMLVYPDGQQIIYHNGWWHGNNSVFYRFIQDTTTLIILSNRYDPVVYHVQPIMKILHENDIEGEVDEGG
ncbi:MAG: beta-lactamase family protein [Thermoflavifilum sp.]|nr:beta-lactamase family protein [Thermoflavifilum sp.]